MKASLWQKPIYVSFEHKSLQELAAALYITRVLEEAVDTEVSFTEHWFPTDKN